MHTFSLTFPSLPRSVKLSLFGKVQQALNRQGVVNLTGCTEYTAESPESYNKR
jgi:hypothetical protein